MKSEKNRLSEIMGYPGRVSFPAPGLRTVARGSNNVRTFGAHSGEVGGTGIFEPRNGLFTVDIGKKKIRVINAVLFLYSGKFYC